MDKVMDTQHLRQLGNGFSLLEVLVVISLVAVIAVTATQLLFSSLSGSGKASSLAVVKQNGDHAIGVIERNIRNAASVDCGAGDSITITDADGEVVVYNITTDQITQTAATDLYLTSDRLVAENLSCSILLGSNGEPEVVSLSFLLRFGEAGVNRASEVASQVFETRVSLRNY